MTSSWIIVLGITPDLSLAELHALFPLQSFQKLSGPCVLLEGDISPQLLRETAGGMVKIARVIKEAPSVDTELFAGLLLEQTTGTQKITFGVSRYDGEMADSATLEDIKHRLEQKGHSARFIQAKEGSLSSVVIEKQKVLELVVACGDKGFFVGTTVAVQDFESWNKRDYGRPYADPKSGMLPPKVARMAVNIAVGDQVDQTILDPFCGMGTILAEALLVGCSVVGSDQSEDVVKKARENLNWLAFIYQRIQAPNMTLFAGDATHVSDKLAPDSIDAIVTEPYMGPAFGGNFPINKSDQYKKIKNIMKGLEKLYIGCLKDWQKVLKPGGKVVIALPKYAVDKKTYFVKKVVDNCENLGYSKILGPIEYSRPQAVVKREFFVFQKK